MLSGLTADLMMEMADLVFFFLNIYYSLNKHTNLLKLQGRKECNWQVSNKQAVRKNIIGLRQDPSKVTRSASYLDDKRNMNIFSRRFI